MEANEKLYKACLSLLPEQRKELGIVTFDELCEILQKEGRSMCGRTLSRRMKSDPDFPVIRLKKHRRMFFKLDDVNEYLDRGYNYLRIIWGVDNEGQ